MNKLKMPFLWAIFTAIVFFSCGDIVDPDISIYNIPENDCDIRVISFQKVYSYFHNQISFGEIINECKNGDTIALTCGLYDNMGTYWDNLPESVISRVITSRGDITFVKLFDKPNTTYTDEWPPPQRRYNSYIIILNNKSYRDGDVITAEIKDKNKILKTILNVRSK